jgi:uncharacterized protein YhaN
VTTKKKPSLQAQLKDAKIELAAAQQEVSKLQKELESDKRMKDHYAKESADAKAELQQIHAFLDAVPNPPTRKTDPNVTGEYSASNVAVLTRLTVFLATRA